MQRYQELDSYGQLLDKVENFGFKVEIPVTKQTTASEGQRKRDEHFALKEWPMRQLIGRAHRLFSHNNVTAGSYLGIQVSGRLVIEKLISPLGASFLRNLTKGIQNRYTYVHVVQKVSVTISCCGYPTLNWPFPFASKFEENSVSNEISQCYALAPQLEE